LSRKEQRAAEAAEIANLQSVLKREAAERRAAREAAQDRRSTAAAPDAPAGTDPS
jgi:hypothetical protein